MDNGVVKNLFRFCMQTQYEGKRSLDTLMSLIEKIPQCDSLLDVGCGDGIRTQIYAKVLEVPLKRIYGIELKEDYIDKAKDHLKIEKIDLEKDSFPFDDQEIHTVICNQVLEHLKNIFQPLREIDRITKVYGYLIIGIPNLAALHNRLLMLLGRQPICNHISGPHVRSFANHAFQEFLKQNQNFTLLSVKGASIYPLPYPFVSIAAKYFPGLAAYTFYLLQKIKHDPQTCGWIAPQESDTCFR
jgi:2-polyprenyl-3-methyl-5-hydroxy-6-metoxy-1,4-benzoquinol methylase